MDFTTFTRISMAINVILIGHGLAQIYEGDPCIFDDNTMGVCKNITMCHSLKRGLIMGTLGYNNIVRCSFIGSLQIVCCVDEILSENSNQTPPKQNTRFSLGSTLREIADKAVLPSWDTKPLYKPGTKAELACERYSRSIPLNLSNNPSDGPINPGEFPYMAAIGYADLNNDIIFDCAGTLISDNYVLSAGHCARPRRPPQMVRLGKVTPLTNDDGIEPIDINIQEIIRHPDYKASTRQNDIALFRLAETVECTNIIRPACLRIDLADVLPNVGLVVTGWGSFTTSLNADERETVQPLLKKRVTSLPLELCNATLIKHDCLVNESTQRESLIRPSQCCAYDSQAKSNICPGDGSVLQTISNISNIASIVGVVSFGIRCGSILPTVYTRVAFYLDWIEAIVWPNF